MYAKEKNGWLKHFDFIILDIIGMQLSLYIAYLFRYGSFHVLNSYYYRRMALTLVVVQLIVVFFCESYEGILKRGYFPEFKQTLRFVSYVLIGFVIFNYLAKYEMDYSRLVIVMVWELGVLFCYGIRYLRKKRIQRNMADSRNAKQSLLILTDSKSAGELVQNIAGNLFDRRVIHGIIILDCDMTRTSIQGVPVVASGENAVQYLCQNWVDEVITTYKGEEDSAESVLMDCEDMGITVHRIVPGCIYDGEIKRVENIGGYTVLTDSIDPAKPVEMAAKRLMDILGGLIGCILTAILFLFVAPAIYINSPGPIFFSQIRIGKNGRRFKIYKFRSMYLDAEKRKQELMAQNKVKSGMMFKMDNDPRIIKGIGHFIRKTSIDEFPQFFNVLKGDMSLVGTRPPTVDEWEKYEKHHRMRMAIKPGLTGMWQVSGRSSITDFEQIVALDTKYIREWSLFLDIRILLKTVKIVIKGSGSQ